MALSTKIRLMIAGPLIGLAGIGLIAKGVSDYSTSSKLKADGIEVAGKVVDMRIQTGRKNSKTYYLKVSYEPKPGESPTGREFDVSKAAYDKAEQTPDVQVRILPSDPSVAQIVGEESNGLFFGALGAGLTIASVFMFRQLFKKDQPIPVPPAV
jgi:hypothetical protein